MPRLGARLLLILLHQAYRCYLVILVAINLCCISLKQLWRVNVNKRGVCAPADLNFQAQLPGKRPLVVALIVSRLEARDCLVDLQRVLALCHDVGVEHVAVYDAAGEIKAACHQFLAEAPLSESLMGGRSGHNQERGSPGTWGAGCQTEVYGPDKHQSPMADTAPHKNGVMRRKEWRPELPNGVPVTRCGGECGCSGQATVVLQEGVGCTLNGGSDGCRDLLGEKGGGTSLGRRDASGDGWTNLFAVERGSSGSPQMESGLQVQASGSRTPILTSTYSTTKALLGPPESSEHIDNRPPALESVNSRLCQPCQTELPAQRVGTTGCEQSLDGNCVGCSREFVDHQTESSKLRNRHIAVDASRNGRKVKHRLEEATAVREQAALVGGGGTVLHTVNGMQERGGSTAGSHRVSLATGVCTPKVPVPRAERMTVDLLSEADGKGALGRAAEAICWDAWRRVQGLKGAEENGHGGQAADNGRHGLAVAAEGVRRLEEEDIDWALAATGGVTREPELVLVFGKALTLAGFPPWLLRNSEIVHVPSLRGVTATCFKRALEDFARRTQRFGK